MPAEILRADDSRLRLLARRRGYYVQKCRAQLGIDNRGGYRILDPNLNLIVAGERFDLDPREVESWLSAHAEGRLAGLLS